MILRGNLAPDGAVVKRQRRRHGKCSCTKALPACSTARTRPSPPSTPVKIKPGDVVVIRYEGPKGGPGMREMLSPTSAIVRHGA